MTKARASGSLDSYAGGATRYLGTYLRSIFWKVLATDAAR